MIVSKDKGDSKAAKEILKGVKEIETEKVIENWHER